MRLSSRSCSYLPFRPYLLVVLQNMSTHCFVDWMGMGDTFVGSDPFEESKERLLKELGSLLNFSRAGSSSSSVFGSAVPFESTMPPVAEDPDA